MCAGYGLLLVTATSLSGRVIGAGIVLAHVILLLGPPLLSQDVFGYLASRAWAPCTALTLTPRSPPKRPRMPSTPFIGWPFLHSPYGPLFTLGSYAAAPLGAAGGLWALKAVMTLASLARSR